MKGKKRNQKNFVYIYFNIFFVMYVSTHACFVLSLELILNAWRIIRHGFCVSIRASVKTAIMYEMYITAAYALQLFVH